MSQASKPSELRQFLGPRFWPTWLTYGLIWLLAHLPYRLQLWIGRGIGLLALCFARRRRHICRTNLALCFPELDAPALRRLLRDTFMANGIGIMEVGLGWCRKPADFAHFMDVTGLEHLQQAQALGRGVLLVSAHFSTMEFAGNLISNQTTLQAMYRPHKNPLLDALMKRGRLRAFGALYERKDVRGALRALKQGEILWYAPDQDYGTRHSVFVKFFGVTAATITATSKFASYNQSPVVFVAHYRKADNSGYSFHFSPALDNYPSGDDAADAQRINDLIEAAIRRHPEQYIWLHRRFKTRPPGEPDVYRREQ